MRAILQWSLRKEQVHAHNFISVGDCKNVITERILGMPQPNFTRFYRSNVNYCDYQFMRMGFGLSQLVFI